MLFIAPLVLFVTAQADEPPAAAPAPVSAQTPEAATALALPPEQERRIVVAPFKALGVPPTVAAQASELLAMELERFERVDVVSAGDIRDLMDHFADAQLLGCEDPACYVDFEKLIPARRLLIGTLSRIDSVTILQAAFFDVVAGRIVARVQIPLGSDADGLISGIRAAAAGLVNADPSLLPADIAVKGELSADVLERGRAAMRPRGVMLRVSAGGIYSTTFAAGAPSDPAFPGGVVRVGVDVPLQPWLAVTTSAWGGYYTGRFVARSSFAFVGDGSVPLPEDTSGTFISDYALAGGGGLLGLRLQVPQGFVRPSVRAGIGVDVLRLDISDLTYVADAGVADAPAPFNEPIPFAPSVSPALSVEVGVGVDFAISPTWSVCVDVAAAGRVHGLEKVSKQSGVVRRDPVGTLGAATLTLGVGYEW